MLAGGGGAASFGQCRGLVGLRTCSSKFTLTPIMASQWPILGFGHGKGSKCQVSF